MKFREILVVKNQYESIPVGIVIYGNNQHKIITIKKDDKIDGLKELDYILLEETIKQINNYIK